MKMVSELKPDDIRIDAYSSSSPSGFSLSIARGVRVTHIPTGISITCESERSQHKNKAIAIEKLKEKLSIMKIKEKLLVSTLKREKLAEWTARARGWFVIAIKDAAGTVIERVWAHDENMYIIEVKEYRPDINGGQAMELVKKFDISVGKVSIQGQWHAAIVSGVDQETGTVDDWHESVGETPEIAICRAVVASVYGEYVEDK